MPHFLTTSGISSEIERIIKEAKYNLTLISPYFQVSDTLLERLYHAAHREVKITIIYGKKKLSEHEERKLKSINCLTLYFCQNLHAKCYFNDNSLIITSMNLYEFSERNNREMGILIEKESDYDMFIEVLNEASSIKKSSKFVYENDQDRGMRLNGHCIRCGINIKLNTDRPYCYPCYKTWQKDQVNNEDHCHNCNRDIAVSILQPVCIDCSPIFSS